MRITPSDMVAAHRLAGRRRPARTAATWGIAALGALMLAVVPAATRPWLGGAVALIVLAEVGQWAVDRFWLPRHAARLHAQHRALHESLDVAIEPDGLRVTTPHAESRLPWSHVLRWHEGPEHVVLMQTDALFVVLPKRELADAELAQLVQALYAHVGKPGQARR